MKKLFFAFAIFFLSYSILANAGDDPIPSSPVFEHVKKYEGEYRGKHKLVDGWEALNPFTPPVDCTVKIKTSDEGRRASATITPVQDPGITVEFSVWSEVQTPSSSEINFHEGVDTTNLKFDAVGNLIAIYGSNWGSSECHALTKN